MSKFSEVVNGLALDQAQAAALTGSVLVRASRTGNTNTLTAGVAHRIAKRGRPAQPILAVTFTEGDNPAAGDDAVSIGRDPLKRMFNRFSAFKEALVMTCRRRVPPRANLTNSARNPAA